MTNTSYERLSPEQLEVVCHVEGPLLVEAGPGSGKTRVLTDRIRHLLTSVQGHFRVLALTFTNKAADEMKDRLLDLGEERDRAFIGTLHSFCLDLLSERGKLLGMEGSPNIFEQLKDRKEVLLKAIDEDLLLSDEINQIEDSKERNKRVDSWLTGISNIKSHPISCAVVDDELSRRVLDAYEAGMRACNAYDFDDLLLLAYRLLVENPKLADLYRRLYKFICIDEAQDMNEAQYAVICALCSDGYKNVMMVGDPRQSIYGFNTSSPEYMERFGREFAAKRVELTANYRSSRAVVKLAQSLDPNYMVAMQLPIEGKSTILVGDNEQDEADKITNELQRLFTEGHPDVEGGIEPSKCAILGRTRFALLAVEQALKQKNIAYYKRLSANHENASETVDDFQLALRVLVNSKDRLHLSALAKKWKVPEPDFLLEYPEILRGMASMASDKRALVVHEAIESVATNQSRLDLMPALKMLEMHADTLPEPDRLAIYEDVAVFRQEWDQYLRASGGSKSLSSFMSSKALGNTQKAVREGVALLTVHSSKGLEFDVVFIAGMAEGTFPDYRAANQKELGEESRNAFVAVTRSKRLLYLTYPATRVMPWGGVRRQMQSRFISVP
ncbi:ATP-dependent helicase [Pseudomonas serboccidentalis]|uniref:DNA 3'-5' helicase n=1 Tax=Pseudomonas serboccidentalis TaxID=2964670 RepID=A0ABY7ZBJ5_9PSED|nr:ATP-dependent helicase [Pseudomonas serboccidentalis]WDR36188.1 ATP-dependent helicase [Pseudomonas serboccidentalis]